MTRQNRSDSRRASNHSAARWIGKAGIIQPGPLPGLRLHSKNFTPSPFSREQFGAAQRKRFSSRESTRTKCLAFLPRDSLWKAIHPNRPIPMIQIFSMMHTDTTLRYPLPSLSLREVKALFKGLKPASGSIYQNYTKKNDKENQDRHLDKSGCCC